MRVLVRLDFLDGDDLERSKFEFAVEGKEDGIRCRAGWGSLSASDDRARRSGPALNLNNVASIQIPAKRVVKFRVAKACKDAVLG